MTQPIENRTLGGLTYNHNMVKSAKQLDNGNYEIIFKTGEKLTYPEQKDFEAGDFSNIDYGWSKQATTAKTGETLPKPVKIRHNHEGEIPTVPRDASVDVSIREGVFFDDTNFNITNVMGATFTSSKDARANVKLNNSSDCTIDLAANDSAAYGDSAVVKNGARNIVKLDDEDSAVINNKRVEGEGTAAQKDY